MNAFIFTFDTLGHSFVIRIKYLDVDVYFKQKA